MTERSGHGPAPMTPVFLPTRQRHRETDDVVTLDFGASDRAHPLPEFAPGQFNMLYVFGVGEVPISISGDPEDRRRLVHTLRGVGAVSKALAALRRGDQVGVRGPFGSAWPLQEAAGYDVLVIAGGIGLAPLRPAIYQLLRHRSHYGRLALLYGARAPEELLYKDQIEAWRHHPDLQVRVTVDRAGPDWIGDVGIVTNLLPKIRTTPIDTVALLCGPEIMIRFTAQALLDRGVAAERIYVSLERNMKCATGSCGHCQLGPHFICKDGPVFRYDLVRDQLGIKEL